MSPGPESDGSARGRHRLSRAVFFFFFFFFSFFAIVTTQMVSGGPAEAHAFSLDLLIAQDVDDRQSVVWSDGPDGFDLAVDQSPDISHPPGSEAGDHLGGIDVEIEVRPVTDAPRSSAQVVVMWGPSGPADLGAWRADNPDGLAIVVGGEPRPGTDITSGPSVTFEVIEPMPETTAVADFEDAISADRGATPSAITATGYDVGTFLDAYLSEFGPNFSEPGALDAVAGDIGQRLVSARIVNTTSPGLPLSEGVEAAPAPDAEEDSSGAPAPVVVVGSLALVGAVAAAVHLGRRRLERG